MSRVAKVSTNLGRPAIDPKKKIRTRHVGATDGEWDLIRDETANLGLKTPMDLFREMLRRYLPEKKFRQAIRPPQEIGSRSENEDLSRAPRTRRRLPV